MAEEIKAQNEQKNTVATVGMWFSITWIVAVLLIILWVVCLIKGFVMGIFLLLIWNILWLLTCWYLNLLVWFILWIVGLFYKPRGKARVAVCIPLVVFIAMASVVCYLWNSVKTPANEFVERVNVEFENIDEENFDKDRFNAIINDESNSIVSSMTEEEFKTMIENSTWSNLLEKWSYVVFGLIQQVFENSLEKYNEGYVPEIYDENQIVTVDVENNEDEDVEEPENDEENSGEENVEVFTQSEQNNIEEILDILE